LLPPPLDGASAAAGLSFLFFTLVKLMKVGFWQLCCED
jgi:hypothetical protein